MQTEVKIDRNILECFSYIFNVGFFLGSNRVVVKDRYFVRSPNNRQNFYSLLLFICSSFSQLYYQYIYFKNFYEKNTVMFISNVLGQLAPFISYIACLLMARFTKQSENIEIFIKLQNIDKMLGLQHDRYFIRFQTRLQNFLTTLLVVLFPLGMLSYAIDVVETPIYTIFLYSSYLTVYIDLVLFGGMLYYICVRMSIFIKLLKNLIRRHVDEREETPYLYGLILLLVHPNIDRIGEQNTLEPDKWVQCMEEILKAYQIITQVFSFQILNITATLFIWTFLALGAIISGFVTRTLTVTSTLLISLWVIFNFVILTLAALLNDWFVDQVKLTKLLWVRIMYYDCDEISRKAANKTLQIINHTDPKFVVYGVFTLNTSLILTLIGVVATNVVVTIQFVVS